MSTLVRTKRRVERSHAPTTALAERVTFTNGRMVVALKDGRALSVPVDWFPRLRRATLKQRRAYEIGGGGISLHWPEIDEDLSIAGLMAGADPCSM